MPRPNTRSLVLEAVQASKVERTVAEVVLATGLSELTVRKHLQTLIKEKSVKVADWKTGNKGRPSKVYWASGR